MKILISGATNTIEVLIPHAAYRFESHDFRSERRNSLNAPSRETFLESRLCTRTLYSMSSLFRVTLADYKVVGACKNFKFFNNKRLFGG